MEESANYGPIWALVGSVVTILVRETIPKLTELRTAYKTKKAELSANSSASDLEAAKKEIKRLQNQLSKCNKEKTAQAVEMEIMNRLSAWMEGQKPTEP